MSEEQKVPQPEEAKKEEFQFQAEMSQLLHLITHSLYTHHEIFLRELISNSSDALNKLHFASLTDAKVLGDDGELKIDIDLNEEEKSFSIYDNGIGMTKDEFISNLGTIASSGTGNFIKQMTGDSKTDLELIGQFGVGFYAVYMVAEEVTVDSRSYESEEGFRWISKGTGSYTIEPIELKERGTRISFKFKKESEEFANKWRIESTIKKYSDFVSFPISLNSEKTNQSTALWAKAKNDIKDEEYKEFFKYIANSTKDPLSWMHLSVEAPVQFNSILFIPEEPDKFAMTNDMDTRLHLYVKRVFIQNDCKELIPQWLRFVKGVVDSEDLNLNISREVTQKNIVMEKINKYLVRKLLGEFKDWSEKEKERYEKFWGDFGYFIKEGIHTDFANREKLIELYRCQSSFEVDTLTSLNDYATRMGTDQEEIYYVYGKNRVAIENSPNLEYFKKNNIEVLYLFDEIDDFIMPSIATYKEKPLVGIDKADLKLKDEEVADKEKDTLEEGVKKKLLGYFKDILGERVEDVIESKRLVDSACTLVSPKEAMNANMERMMKMMDQDFKGGKRVMEVNMSNPLIQHLSDIQKKFPQDSMLKDCIEQLFEGASLLEGTLEDPSKLVPRTTLLMEKATELYLKSLES
ncbi:MAG: molecular chaperone HtpG [Deltaproteobacteria bacterium]|jgi:molecular chaperone HtpG|nr:molecular chaperone HtpG [Deltaproteobacteria bacterium]MBT4265403.1 molecular chaperone HtpG [Deltaproteobacteria bacterium]MBT4638750.1 molecular chaperone HtpG [Deltaproteobacteria bacterium]MBT6499679.1 molecular chaperone HtpG [Deltaproteobacteria bacterium]